MGCCASRGTLSHTTTVEGTTPRTAHSGPTEEEIRARLMPARKRNANPNNSNCDPDGFSTIAAVGPATVALSSSEGNDGSGVSERGRGRGDRTVSATADVTKKGETPRPMTPTTPQEGKAEGEDAEYGNPLACPPPPAATSHNNNSAEEIDDVVMPMEGARDEVLVPHSSQAVVDVREINNDDDDDGAIIPGTPSNNALVNTPNNVSVASDGNNDEIVAANQLPVEAKKCAPTISATALQILEAPTRALSRSASDDDDDDDVDEGTAEQPIPTITANVDSADTTTLRNDQHDEDGDNHATDASPSLAQERSAEGATLRAPSMIIEPATPTHAALMDAEGDAVKTPGPGFPLLETNDSSGLQTPTEVPSSQLIQPSFSTATSASDSYGRQGILKNSASAGGIAQMVSEDLGVTSVKSEYIGLGPASPDARTMETLSSASTVSFVALTCNHCNKAVPVKAWRCTTCAAFILCEECLMEEGVHDDSHQFDEVNDTVARGASSGGGMRSCKHCDCQLEEHHRFFYCSGCPEMYICEDCVPDFAPEHNALTGHVLHEAARRASRVVTETNWVSKTVLDDGNKTINNYVVLRNIGQGGFAKVKLVQDVNTRQQFALKIVKRAGLWSSHEVAVMKRLHHTNVVRLYEVIDDVECNKVYMVMEYVPKGPVCDMQNLKPLCVDVVRSYLKQIIDGLCYVHAQKIYHRDIKPDNILVADDGTVKLTDFGVSTIQAKQQRPTTPPMDESSGSGCAGPDAVLVHGDGTPVFLSPEYYRQDPISLEMADAWALGITLYIMAFGRLPYRACSIPDLRVKVMDVAIDYDDAPTSGAVSEQLLDVIKKLLHPDLKQRWDIHGIRSHSFLDCLSPISQREYTVIEVTEAEKAAAIRVGHNVSLQFASTINALLRIKKWFARNRKSPSEVNIKPSAPAPKNVLPTEDELLRQEVLDKQVGDLIANTIAHKGSELNLDCHQFSSLPREVYSMVTLRVLSSQLNGMTSLDNAFAGMSRLVKLSLTRNALTVIPSSVGQLTQLEHLDLSRNDISELPSELGGLKNLRIANFDHNKLKAIPLAVISLPRLSHLYCIENPDIDVVPAPLSPSSSSSSEANGAASQHTVEVAIDNKPILVAAAPPRGVHIMWHKIFPDRVRDYLFLGSIRTVQSARVIRQLDVRQIVTCGNQLKVLDPIPAGVEHTVIPLCDLETADVRVHISTVVNTIERTRRSGRRVVVHCFAGVSRSATCVIAYLMLSEGISLESAVAQVKEARPCICPNEGFKRQLRELEADINSGKIKMGDDGTVVVL
eukprot:PhM_4_TR2667/c0_g1_i1/m.71706